MLEGGERKMLELFRQTPLMNKDNTNESTTHSKNQDRGEEKTEQEPVIKTSHAPGSEGADPHGHNSPRSRGGKGKT